MATDVAALIARVKTLVNNDLKKICKEEGQIQTGNKSVLQQRVIQIINDALNRGESDKIARLRYRVANQGNAPPAGSSMPAQSQSYSNPYNGLPHTNGTAAMGGYASYGMGAVRPAVATASGPRYKPSPFYEILEQVGTDLVLEASPSHRNHKNKQLELSPAQSSRIQSDQSIKLLLFAHVDQSGGFRDACRDIAFPAQLEVKVNGGDIKSNWKGLKNKPGSTRPADITNEFRVTPAYYKNTLAVTYALTKEESIQRFVMQVYIVRKQAVEALAKRIGTRNVITKQSVLDEMRRKANDPDIEVGSIKMGLKDPVSTMRINIPCRSTVCTHIQCFDAECFLLLQEQAPTWTCPICHKTVSYESLAVDQYTQEILNTVPESTDQVTIEPNGKWSWSSDEANDGSPTPARNGYNDSEDDIVDITDLTDDQPAIKKEARNNDYLHLTPSMSSREARSAPRASTGSKRKSEVIDLTLSDDDDEPPRPAKKVAYTCNTPSSLPDPSRRYQVPAYGNASTHSRPPFPPSAPGSAPRHDMSRSELPSRTLPVPAGYAPAGEYSYYPQRPYEDDGMSLQGSAALPQRPSSPPRRPPYDPTQPSNLPPPPPPSRPRYSYPGQGTAAYPTYLGSSP